MAAESLSIRSIDQMTSTLRAMSTSADLVINTFERMQSASRDVVNTTTLQTAHVRLSQISYVAEQVNTEVQNASSQQKNFNQQIASGRSQAEGLSSSVKHYAAELLNAKNAGKIIAIADEATLMRNRLDLMNYGLDTTSQLQQKVFETAQRSRGAYQTTANAVAKLGIQARGAFTSNDELIAFVEQLNKSFVIAGTSVQGVDSTMLQLTQAMASGRLQGEGLNTVLDNAKPIVQNIADYMGVPVGQIKQLASEGAITAEIIKNAMFAATDETNTKFEQMPVTFGQVANNIQNRALMAFQPALQQLSGVTQTAEFQSLVNGVITGIQTMSQAAVTGLDTMEQAVRFVQENWSWLAPIIGGVAAAMLIYNGAIVANNIVQGISNGIKLAAMTMAVAHGTTTVAEAAATTGATSAQIAFNAAVLACPLTLLILIIIGAITAIYAIIGAINNMKGTTISATGIIASAFAVLGAFIANQFIIPVWNIIAEFINFFYNVWNDPIAAVKILFLDLASDVIVQVANMAHAIEDVINRIPGVHVDITSGLDDFRRRVESAAAKVKSESAWKEIVSKREFIDIGNVARNVYEWGSEKEAGFKNKFSGIFNPNDNTYTQANLQDMSDNINGAAENTGRTADNTAAMADRVNMMDEDLKYMRDMAEQEIINRFTTAELTVNMGGITNQISGQMDLDGISDYLGNVIFETLDTAAEGAY